MLPFFFYKLSAAQVKSRLPYCCAATQPPRSEKIEDASKRQGAWQNHAPPFSEIKLTNVARGIYFPASGLNLSRSELTVVNCCDYNMSATIIATRGAELLN